MLTLDQIVDMDDTQSQKLSWNKLNKSLKLKRLIEYATEYSLRENLSDTQQEQLKTMLRDKLDKKYLHRARDVDYNIDEQRIVSIPALVYNQKFTLKTDAVSPLSSLAPKNKTKRNI